VIDHLVNRIIHGNCLEVLKEFPDESIDFIMFSPPYYRLRDYGEGTNTVWGGDPNCEHEWEPIIIKKERGSYTNSSWKRPSRDNEAKWEDKYSQICKKCGAWYGQLGLEPSWKMYVEHIVQICRELKRVLKKTGNMYIVLGDTYFGGGHGGNTVYDVNGKKLKDVKYGEGRNYVPVVRWADDVYKPKCLMGIPWRVAFALIDDGWILRSDIIWYKPNATPESVKDRVSNRYEHIFHFVKSRKYYYNLDMIRIPHKKATVDRSKYPVAKFGDVPGVRLSGSAKISKPFTKKVQLNPSGANPGDIITTEGNEGVSAKRERLKEVFFGNPPTNYYRPEGMGFHPLGRNPGDFWEIATRPFHGPHFAIYPIDICLYPILSSCPPDGIVLDPMCGSGTTCYAAELINRKRWDEFKIYVNEYARKVDWKLKWIGIEINKEYCKIARERIDNVLNQLTLAHFIGDDLNARS